MGRYSPAVALGKIQLYRPPTRCRFQGPRTGERRRSFVRNGTDMRSLSTIGYRSSRRHLEIVEPAVLAQHGADGDDDVGRLADAPPFGWSTSATELSLPTRGRGIGR